MLSNYNAPSAVAIGVSIAVSSFNVDCREPCALGSCCYWICLLSLCS